jgi:16S rRNA (uracil1498-N3)-methyltransferase
MISSAADVSPTSPILYGDERLTAHPIAQLLRGDRHPSGLLIAAGGLQPRRVRRFRRHPWLHPCRLGARVIRAETAALIGLALITANRDGIHQP